MILCGATAVQVGTCHWTEGPKCFDRISKELEDIMNSKGYNSIDEFKNKLKDWSKEGAGLARAAKMKKNRDKKSEALSSSITSTANVGGNNQIMTAVLAVVIAVLLADKMNIISI